MIRITADTLEEAYTKASKELNHSVVDLDIEVLQAPSSGFLGFFKKPTIIRASVKGEENHHASASLDNKVSPEYNEIEQGIIDLLKSSCFDIGLVDLEICEDIVHIKLDGEDAALMIGKEGYRYKALSYVLHNWIKIKYNKNISLEIAEFLKNQDIMIEEYLQGIKERIDDVGKAQTKPLDGILVKLALEKLRATYPDKYVAIRTIRDGRKIVIVNAYRKDK
jgi:spoIIIJ-associated protein